MDEVEEFSNAELAKYLNKRRVPVVLGPKKIPHMLDRHHTCLCFFVVVVGCYICCCNASTCWFWRVYNF